MIPHAHYNEKMAGIYDLMYPEYDTAMAVELVTELCPPAGSVLDLGVGTGKLALPLVERGFEVHGIEASEAMLAKLKERDPGGTVKVLQGDFTTDRTGRRFDVITLFVNTFFMAVTQDQQLSLLRNVREQLAEGGKFVLEAFEPALFLNLQRPEVSVRYLGDSTVMLDTLLVDRSQQLMVGWHTIFDGGPPSTTQHVLRYAFPAEIDLLAHMAGLELVDRWGNWTKEPYTATSVRHVSVYQRSGPSE